MARISEILKYIVVVVFILTLGIATAILDGVALSQ